MDFKKQEKYFIGKYFLKEFMNVKREDLEEPATIDLYMAEIVRNSLQEKETEVLLDEIYESGAVISHAGNDIPDSSQILERYIELYMDNEDDFPSTRNIFYMTGDIKLLLKNYLYEIAHLFARMNGIETIKEVLLSENYIVRNGNVYSGNNETLKEFKKKYKEWKEKK